MRHSLHVDCKGARWLWLTSQPFLTTDSEEVLPKYIQEGDGRQAIQTFIKSWSGLRGHDKKRLSNIIMKDIADGRARLRERDDALNFKVCALAVRAVRAVRALMVVRAVRSVT